MFQNKSVNVNQFAMVPNSHIPRSSFKRQSTLKTAFDSGYLVPVYLDEVLPGDSFRLNMTAFARLATPIVPVLDNLWLETFFFFVPNRLVWTNWVKLMGQQDNPGDSISFIVPQQVSPVSGYAVGSLQDYFGLPTVGQMTATTKSHSALPLRAYNLIYNEWFRDENLINSVTVDKGDGPDTVANYTMLRRGKRKDYFTSCLPWPQKGSTAVSLPLGTSAPVKTQSSNVFTGVQSGLKLLNADGTSNSAIHALGVDASSTFQSWTTTTPTGNIQGMYPSNLYADLSAATSATINQLRQSFQIQALLETDARGGTRYTEKVKAHFGVNSPDSRLQRPEYLGGGSTRININPIAQTSGTSASGTTTPLGNLAAMGTGMITGHGFTQSFVEHGHIIGLANVRADLTYQQGLRKLWSRSTMYDFYFPVFADLGEQSVLNQEIYVDGSANDTAVFGYQSRWDEYRYFPSLITGLFRSTSASTVDIWHFAQKFTSLPTLNSTFINDTPPLSRNLAVGAAANGQQLLFDAFFDIRTVRPLPMYSIPGQIGRF